MSVTVVSVDGSPYLAWQAALLKHSHRRVRQPGDVVVLTETVEVEGDPYPPYNKPYAISQWIERQCPQFDTVLVLDPDMVFVWPVTRSVERGRPVATDSRYQVDGLLRVFLRQYTAVPQLLQPIAVPLLIHRDDLRNLAPRWFSHTVRLRADPAVRAVASWVCEMWACSLAAQELGLTFELEHGAALPPADRRTDAPLIHYSWAFEGFDKRTYRPWEPLPPGTSQVYCHLRELIAEYREAGSPTDFEQPPIDDDRHRDR